MPTGALKQHHRRHVFRIRGRKTLKYGTLPDQLGDVWAPEAPTGAVSWSKDGKMSDPKMVGSKDE